MEQTGRHQACGTLTWCKDGVAPLLQFFQIRCANSASATFLPPLVKGGPGGVGQVTVESTTEHMLGAIDEFNFAVRGLSAVYCVRYRNVVTRERQIH